MIGNGLIGSTVIGSSAVNLLRYYKAIATTHILEAVKTRGLSLSSFLERTVKDMIATNTILEATDMGIFATYTGLEGVDYDTLGVSTDLDYEKVAGQIAALTEAYRDYKLEIIGTKASLEKDIAHRLAFLSTLETTDLINIAADTLIEAIKTKGFVICSRLEKTNTVRRFSLQTILEAGDERLLGISTDLDYLVIETLAANAVLEADRRRLIGLITALEKIEKQVLGISILTEATGNATIAIESILEGTNTKTFGLYTKIFGDEIFPFSMTIELNKGIFGFFEMQPIDIDNDHIPFEMETLSSPLIIDANDTPFELDPIEKNIELETNT